MNSQKVNFPLPWLAGGDEGEGERTDGNTVAYHPHPNPPPSRGRKVGTFYEGVKINSYYLVAADSVLEEIISEHFKEGGFAAPSYPGDNLDDRLVLEFNQFVQIRFPVYQGNPPDSSLKRWRIVF